MKTYYVQIEQLRTDEYLKLANRNFVEPVLLKSEVINELKKILPRQPKMDGEASWSQEQKQIGRLISNLSSPNEAAK